MLTTIKFTNLGLELTGVTEDSTVTFLPGTAWIGNSLQPWTGTQFQISSISNFSSPTKAGNWQNALLYLIHDSTQAGTDMTVAYSPMVPSDSFGADSSLLIPSMDTTGYPLSLFTLYSTTGSDCTLVNYTKI